MTARELERIARHHRPVLIAFAGRWARSDHDCEDAVQDALAAALANPERIRSETAVAYVAVSARRAALHLRRKSERTVSLDEPTADGACRHEAIADPRQADVDERLDTIGALRRLKRDQARALAARALGYSYREIGEAYGWSYTKTNRCVTEGRAALRAQLASDQRSARSPSGEAPLARDRTAA